MALYLFTPWTNHPRAALFAGLPRRDDRAEIVTQTLCRYLLSNAFDGMTIAVRRLDDAPMLSSALAFDYLTNEPLTHFKNAKES